MNFGTRLPILALDSPLLFSAVIALSAMQISKTVSAKTLDAAEFYHGHCVRLLIGLDSQATPAERQIALSSACLLRTYEIQDGGCSSALRHAETTWFLTYSRGD